MPLRFLGSSFFLASSFLRELRLFRIRYARTSLWIARTALTVGCFPRAAKRDDLPANARFALPENAELGVGSVTFSPLLSKNFAAGDLTRLFACFQSGNHYRNWRPPNKECVSIFGEFGASGIQPTVRLPVLAAMPSGRRSPLILRNLCRRAVEEPVANDGWLAPSAVNTRTSTLWGFASFRPGRLRQSGESCARVEWPHGG